MADVEIYNLVVAGASTQVLRCGPFWTSEKTGYLIFKDNTSHLRYKKTTDGGATWDLKTIYNDTIKIVDCWADWQTPADNGTNIHIAFIRAHAPSRISYVCLNTNGDTLDVESTVFIPITLGATVTWAYNLISITKSEGGNLCIAVHWYDAFGDDQYGFYTSPDGVTWTSKVHPFADTDLALLFSGNETDSNDIWCVYWDVTAHQISLKTYDNDGNSWSSQLIAANMEDTGLYLQMDGQIRLSDAHLILAAVNKFNDATTDIMVWDINGAGSITAKTNVITNEANTFAVSVFIDHNTDDIYITYFSGTSAESQVKCFYQKSTDGGATWGGEQAMQVDAEDDERWVSAGCIKPDWGGFFMPVWYNDDLGDLFCNTDNAIAFAGYKLFPVDQLLRVSGIKRSFWAGVDGQSVYQAELYLGGISTTYVSPLGNRDTQGAVTPTPAPVGPGYQESDYLLWIRLMSWDEIYRIFGKFPTYEMWVTWKQRPNFPRYF